MNKPNNTHLSGKFLSLAIEALECLIKKHEDILNNSNVTEEELAEIDYGNDLQCVNTLYEEWTQQKKREKEFVLKKNIAPKSLNEIINKKWSREKLLLFATHISFAVTICIRDIWANNKTPVEDKINATLHLNEINHLIMQRIMQLSQQTFNQENGNDNFVETCVEALTQNEITKQYTFFIVRGSYEKSKMNGKQKSTQRQIHSS